MAEKKNIAISFIETNKGQIDGVPSNPRTIKDKKFKKLVQSIEANPEMLDLRELLVYPLGDKYVIIGGNMRYEACKKLGYKELPCKVIPPETDAGTLCAYVVKDNGGYGEWDFDMLANEWDEELLDVSGIDLPEIKIPSEQAEEDDFDESAPVETRCKVGDVWQLGEHRLMCGDSTETNDVKKLMNTNLADMVFTDPPYGVNVKGGKNNTTIAGDLTQVAIPFSFDQAIRYTRDKAHFYFCGAESNISLYYKLFEKHLQQIPKLCIWVKNNFAIKQIGFHTQYEILFFGYKKGGGNVWHCGRTMEEASDIWMVKKDPSSEYVHPTQKPIELITRALKISSKEGELVLDLFGGSGSTLIACEQVNRKCYTMELDPHYCDVILARWEKFTGKTAERL
ncbi:MAG: DNA methyltransferase [Acutalibacteraceae bacterium]|nr:DNA methyltransferase [Acutalibacteraceae bacterium]